MTERYADRVAVVTGAAQGIGAATARRLSADGCTVVVVDLTEERALGTATAIEEAGGSAIAVGCDVADSAQVEAAVAGVVDRFGRLDVLVNNAGLTRDNLLFKLTEADWDAVIDVNLKSAFLMSKAASKPMVEARHGKIVNLSSISAKGNRGQANYAAAKMGIQGFTATLAEELGPFGINVNAVAPGYVATAMTAATALRVGMTPEEHQEAAAARTNLRRVAHPEDIANVIAFLVSEDAAFVTGQTIYATGNR